MKSLRVQIEVDGFCITLCMYGYIKYHFCTDNLIQVPLAQSTTKYCNLFRVSFESMEISITIFGLYATEILFETLFLHYILPSYDNRCFFCVLVCDCCFYFGLLFDWSKSYGTYLVQWMLQDRQCRPLCGIDCLVHHEELKSTNRGQRILHYAVYVWTHEISFLHGQSNSGAFSTKYNEIL